jgi:hypothetical protein
MRRAVVFIPVLVVVAALVGSACAPLPAPVTWTVRPASITVHDGEDNDGGDEPYVIQVGFRSEISNPGSSTTSISSQCYRNRLPAMNAGPDGATVNVPAGAADVAFTGVENVDIADLLTNAAAFEVIGTLSFVMERDGIFAGGCAISDALRTALLDVIREALELLIASAPQPPTIEELIDLLVANIGDFLAAAGSLIGAVLEGFGNPDDVVGVAAQIHLPTKGTLSELVNTALRAAGLTTPGAGNGIIPIDGLPGSLQIRVGTLTPSTTTFRFTTPAADYSYVSTILR